MGVQLNALRKVTNFFNAHRWLSLITVCILIGAVTFSWTYKKKLDGEFTPPLRKGSIVLSVYGIGTVTANKSFQMRPGTTTNVSRLYVAEGDFVRKGDRLADMDLITYRAPFDGTITFLPFKLGENIFSFAVALSLVNMADCYVLVSMEQQGALRVKRGQKALISFDTDRSEKYEGIVKSVYSNANSFLARVEAVKLPEKILPGMTADVAIQIEEHQDVLLAPVAAIEQGYVWVKRANRFPKKVAVKLGIVDKEMAEIVSGDLQEGDRLLIRKNIKP